MPTVNSLPSAGNIVTDDLIALSQVNADGSITLRKASLSQINASIVTGVVNTTTVSINAVPFNVLNLPIIAATGGGCTLTGTITVMNTNTFDIAMWNIILVTLRNGTATMCTVEGDNTPSAFTAIGTLSSIAPPICTAGASGPVITLTGINAPLAWGINLNSTLITVD